ncbi:metallophosphoesterase [Rhodnius prolixus]|uniref:metallophosphoesterase n=1 Tax=Rhodnius prolixus TaxID=13249 RepID=UPI003D18B06E
MPMYFCRKLIFTLRKYFRGKYSNSLLLHLIAFIVVINEWIVYCSYKNFWPNTICGDLQDYYKVLFVADPQILGENTESWIARWDSDRFLRKTYLYALQHAEPSVVVFLGDLMDEGSQADDEQFSRYFTRFKRIFNHESSSVNMTIFLPGDNDIGGEDELIFFPNVKRFENYFDKKPIVERYQNIEFYKVNKLLRRFPTISNKNNTIRIAVSHIPLLGYADETTEKVITRLRPHLIFSGHDHKSVHFVGDLNTGETIYVEVFNDRVKYDRLPKWRFQSSKSHTNEILVPTCSYRMGVQNIGYGLAVIDKKGEYFCYQILWLPQRLTQLKVYLYCIPPIILLMLFPTIKRFYNCLVCLK